MAEDWTREEVEVIVSRYFEMLQKQEAGVPYNKSEVRREILPILKNRSEASVEFKNRNISAVLNKIGQPYILGYVPANNYQRVLLEEIVVSHIAKRPEIENTFRLFADTAPESKVLKFESMLEETPAKEAVVEDAELSYRSPVKVNYIEMEQANRKIGSLGESIAIEYERWRLVHAGKESFADKIEWVAQTQGDGLGYDILSKNTNGTDRYIEVKATKLTKEAPFYFSEREYDFSKRNSSRFYLYRVFNIREDPKLFIANGAYHDFCNLRPTKFKGVF